MFRPIEGLLPSMAPLLAASIMPGPPPEMTAKPASDKARLSETVQSYQGEPALSLALPNIETAGRTEASFSVASTNSEIMPRMCHDSRDFCVVER